VSDGAEVRFAGRLFQRLAATWKTGVRGLVRWGEMSKGTVLREKRWIHKTTYLTTLVSAYTCSQSQCHKLRTLLPGASSSLHDVVCHCRITLRHLTETCVDSHGSQSSEVFVDDSTYCSSSETMLLCCSTLTTWCCQRVWITYMDVACSLVSVSVIQSGRI